MSKRPSIQFNETQAQSLPTQWRSLDEKEQTLAARAERAAHEESVAQDEPSGERLVTISPGKNGLGRRTFFGATGVGVAAGFAGCARRPVEQILPYTRAVEYSLPGVELHFASTLSINGDVTGVLVESHEGRPTKIEGNPSHPYTAAGPGSHAGTSLHVQADILNLYDYDRSKFVVHKAEDGRRESDWASFDAFFRERLTAAGQGEGLHVLSEPTTSPTALRLRQAFQQRFPQAKVHTWSALSQKHSIDGTGGVPLVNYAQAKVVVAADSDFLGTDPGSARNAKAFMQGRLVRSPNNTMNRLYAIESTLSVTGATADHRLAIKSGEVEAFLHALAGRLGVTVQGAAPAAQIDAHWVQAVAEDLQAAGPAGVVVVGSRQPARVHALGKAINDRLGVAGGSVVSYVAAQDRVSGLADLVTALNGNQVKTLVMLGGNPVYTTAADVLFRDALAKAEVSIHLASHDNETSALCTWHLPEAHQLESWGDHVALDGSYSIQQPLIQPFCSGRSALDIWGLLAGERSFRAYAQVRNTFGKTEVEWTHALHAGFSHQQPQGTLLAVDADAVSEPAVSSQGWEVVFAADNKMLDGRYLNNPWLQELPDPISKLTWDNAALIAPEDAAELGVTRDGDLITIAKSGKSLTIPAFRLPGHARQSITLPLGWGREHAGQVGNGTGFNTYAVMLGSSAFAGGYEVSRAGGRYPLAVTQEHHSMTPPTLLGIDQPERPLSIETTLTGYRAQPNFAQWREPSPDPDHMGPLWGEEDYNTPRLPAQGGLSWSLFPQRRPAAPDAPLRYRWGMSMDLNACTGCSACIVACNAENNVATVGKDQVIRGREMHWLRLDRYFSGAGSDTKVHFQPVACQQCEEAPCENVCPVNATAHSPEGLNDMAYNRCVGTRYCMNNCPYKVRRFNFLAYQAQPSDFQRMQFNPNVSVRMRGVMEKCSYCVQRIQAGRIAAKNEYRQVRDGEIQPACAQACPTQALVFGNLNDPNSAVSRLSNLDRHYKLLENVGTQPRTTYLGKIRHVNPALAGHA